MTDVLYNVILLHNMIRLNHAIYLWQYDASRTLMYTDCPEDSIINDMIGFFLFGEDVSGDIENKLRTPLVISNDVGLIWCIDYHYEKNELENIFVIGPFFTGKNTQAYVKDQLDSHNFSVSTRSRIFRELDKISIASSSHIKMYAQMLHYCITKDKILLSDLRYPAYSTTSASDDLEAIDRSHAGVWANAQLLLKAIENGSMEVFDAIDSSHNLSSGVKVKGLNSLRKSKDDAIVLLTLISRAAIKGGLNPATSYDMNDYYLGMIEAVNTHTEMSALSNRMITDYITKVRGTKENQVEVSKCVMNTCDYIKSHVADPLSIDSLAEMAGYTEYYYSHRFKQEMGISLKEYIKKEKLERAALLLSSTHMSIQEICDGLSFGTRSFFSTSFTREYGMSPSEYRAAKTVL